MTRILHLLAMTLFLPCLLAGQIPQGMTFTVGTTARDGGGQDHAFLLWEAPKADIGSAARPRWARLERVIK